MKVKQLLELLKNIDPETRIIIDDKDDWYHEIEEVAIEKDLDHDESDPVLIAVIYPRRLEQDEAAKNEANTN